MNEQEDDYGEEEEVGSLVEQLMGDVEEVCEYTEILSQNRLC